MSLAQNEAERNFHKRRRAVYSKISKPIFYDGEEFPSIAALQRHLKLTSTTQIYKGLNKGKLNGKSIYRVKK